MLIRQRGYANICFSAGSYSTLQSSCKIKEEKKEKKQVHSGVRTQDREPIEDYYYSPSNCSARIRVVVTGSSQEKEQVLRAVSFRRGVSPARRERYGSSNKRDFSEGLKRRGKETPLMPPPASLTDATSAD